MGPRRESSHDHRPRGDFGMSSHWMLYCYDALGLGHARRMTSIARRVLPDRPDLSALLVTCSPYVDSMPMPPGLDYIKLPSARKLTAQEYVARSLRIAPDRLRDLRAGIIDDAIRSYSPDLLLVDKSPCGMMGDLAPALERLHASPCRSTQLVLGWRDVLDAPERVAAEWRRLGTLEWIAKWYDELWVYGDPRVYDVRVEYRMPRALAERVRYMGYLAPAVDEPAVQQARLELGGPGPVALVCAGGGEDGEALLATWIEAAASGTLPAELRSVVVTGPQMPAEARRRLRAACPASARIVDHVPGLEAMIAAADVVVGMAGYNMACEVLGSGSPAVLVPRAAQREEQRIRAARLAGLGLTECVFPEHLDARSLAAATRRALERGRPRAAEALDLGGLTRVAGHVDRLLPPLSPGRGSQQGVAMPTGARP